MALDVLIGILLLISAIVNILALGAFWITPSLRTTSNRFVINLLIANLASCIILAPSFLLNAATGDSGNIENMATINNNSHLILKTTEINETIKCFTNNNSNNNISNDCISNISNIKIVNNYSNDNSDDVITKHFTEIKCWGLDLAAALGSLSVLLVVGDTWCAVTDPLRYHTRISSLKAWILIISMWFISAVFGFGSAFRNQKFIMAGGDYKRNELIEDIRSGHDEIINKTIQETIVLGHFSITQNLYTTIYSYLFFIVIILLPFIVVCAMYWRIFSEARGNGLRMRQNGSSPLLQSALNLASNQHNNNNNNTNSNNNNNNSNSNEKQQQQQQQQQQQHQQTPTHYTGLTLKIDNNSNNLEKPPIRLDLTKATERNHNNILLTVTTDTPTIMKSANSIEYMRRNHSARQLFLLESTNNIKNCGDNIRHVHSTPNLQKLMFNESTHHHSHHHHHGGANGYANHSPGNTLSANLQVPPKALSYMTSIRHRLSNASSLFKYREESRAARISILVVIMFLISYLPYGILILIQGHVSFITSYQSAVIAILTVLLANLSSPFIFAYRNKRVCRGVKHLLGLEKKPNQNNIFRGGRNNTYKTTVSKVKRNCSKASAYSQASNRYLTPQSAVKGTFVLEIEKCTDDEDSSYEEKKSFLKRICDTSRKWDCTTDSCSGKIDNEQTEV